MANIIAGVFESMADAEHAATQLENSGVAKDEISIFALNAPGQHDLYPIGGDEEADPGAQEAHSGAASGALIGGAACLGAGVAAMAATGVGPVVAVAAAAVGAYTGSLVGALNSLGDAPQAVHPDPATERHAGIMLAVNAPQESTVANAIASLRENGAQQIEQAQGEWRGGQWVDFDPRTPPVLVNPGSASDLSPPRHPVA